MKSALAGFIGAIIVVSVVAYAISFSTDSIDYFVGLILGVVIAIVGTHAFQENSGVSGAVTGVFVTLAAVLSVKMSFAVTLSCILGFLAVVIWLSQTEETGPVVPS
jgi:4-amino-4-deoxy-L-arabinose transferase-like glycosyltransferase